VPPSQVQFKKRYTRVKGPNKARRKLEEDVRTERLKKSKSSRAQASDSRAFGQKASAERRPRLNLSRLGGGLCGGGGG